MLASTQQVAAVPIAKEVFEQLNLDQHNLLSECRQLEGFLQQILSSHILSPLVLSQVLDLTQEIYILIKKLGLCQEELNYFFHFNPTAPPPSRW